MDGPELPDSYINEPNLPDEKKPRSLRGPSQRSITMVYLGQSSANSESANTITGSLILPPANKNGTSPSSSSAAATTTQPRAQQMQLPQQQRTDSTSGEEDSDEREGRIRVGKDYQATTPSYIPPHQRRPEQTPERALLVWSPASHLSETKLDEYIQMAKEKFGYNAEQALGMLFWHKHDLDRAIQDLANFTPFPDEWSIEDKVLFEQAFQFHGKSFHRIRQMLPDKTIAQLVKYYYGWKKTRTRTSLMDRQARKLQLHREEKGANEGEEVLFESDMDEDKSSAGTAAIETNEQKEISRKPKCFNCGILCHVTMPTPKGQMCGTCHQYYTRTGNVRPTTAPTRKDGTRSRSSIFKNSSQPPKGMYINHDDLVTLATGPESQGEALLKSMDRTIDCYKRTVQQNKQYLSALHSRTRDLSHIEPYRIPEPDNSKITSKWSNDELLLGVHGIRTFGKSFKLIAEILGTKTEAHVRSFFVNYRRRYNLDAALKEYEAEHGPSLNDDEEVKIIESDEVSKMETDQEVANENRNGSASNKK